MVGTAVGGKAVGVGDGTAVGGTAIGMGGSIGVGVSAACAVLVGGASVALGTTAGSDVGPQPASRTATAEAINTARFVM